MLLFQNYLIFQPVFKYFQIFKSKSKRFLEVSIITPATSGNSFAPKLTYIPNFKIAVKFEENCQKQAKAFFTHRNVVIILLLMNYVLRVLKTNFTWKDYLFGAVKLTKNADPNKCSYSGYGIGFDSRSLFLKFNSDFGKNVNIFGVGNSSSKHTDNNKKRYFSSWRKTNTRIGQYYNNSRG